MSFSAAADGSCTVGAWLVCTFSQLFTALTLASEQENSQPFLVLLPYFPGAQFHYL